MAKTTLTQEKLKIIKQGISREKNIADLGIKFYLLSLKSFEKKYKMKTKEFLKNFQSGKLGDDQQWFDWLFAYKAYNNLNKKLRAISSISIREEIQRISDV